MRFLAWLRALYRAYDEWYIREFLRECTARNLDKQGVRCERRYGHLAKNPEGYHAARYYGGVFYWADDAVGAQS